MATSGQTTVTTSGTAVQLGSQVINGPLLVKAKTTNTGLVAVGNDGGDVTMATGYTLAPGAAAIFEYVGNLSSLWIDSAVNGEGLVWLALNV